MAAKKESKAEKVAAVDEPVAEPKAPKVESITGIPVASGKDIDTRMADLYEDHKRMGVRE